MTHQVNEKLSLSLGELGFMPRALKDETLYSVIARLQTWALVDSPGQLSLDLFGNRNVPATVDLPSHLNFFSSRAKPVFIFSEDQVIERLTLWPYYSRFLLDRKKARVIEIMKGNNGSGLHNLVGINPSAMNKNTGLKYCPACSRDDKKYERLYYWHRVHQIPDLYACPDHKCKLITYFPKITDLKRSFYIDANEVIEDIPAIQKESNERLIELSVFMASILRGESTFDINNVDYKSLLSHSAFIKGSKKIEDTFTESFISFYGEDLLEMILPGISKHWLKGIVNRPFHFFHPIRHVMMTHFLSQVPRREEKSLSFGKGPWTCINKAADHFGKKIITDISIHFDRKTKRQIARLRCDCGMVYTKSQISRTGKEPREFIRVVRWGEVWLNALKYELSSRQSFRTIARKLGTDAKTISKYASTGKKEKQNNISSNQATQVNRRKWERLLEKFTKNKIASARNQNPALYIWLYRHDSEWLRKINKSNSSGPFSSELRLNWNKLDSKVLDLIVETIDRLKREKYKGRITKSLIAKVIRGQHYLLGKNAAKFPRSIAFMDSNVESQDQFHQRRILEAIKELKSTNQLKGWKVMRRAGLGNNFSSSSKLLLESHLSYGT